MRKFLVSAVAIPLIVGSSLISLPNREEASAVPVVHGSFTSSHPDWSFKPPTTHVQGEINYYSAKQVSVKGGVLSITETKVGNKWESGFVTSKTAHTYGTWTFRAKVSNFTQGSWPGIYLEGVGPWPQTGEVDIMESVTRLFPHHNENMMSEHGPLVAHPTKEWVIETSSPVNFAVYNNFSLQKTPTELVFRINNRVVCVYKKSALVPQDKWSFNTNRYQVMMDLAMGDFGGSPNKTTAKKITLDVQWLNYKS